MNEFLNSYIKIIEMPDIDRNIGFIEIKTLKRIVFIILLHVITLLIRFF